MEKGHHLLKPGLNDLTVVQNRKNDLIHIRTCRQGLEIRVEFERHGVEGPGQLPELVFACDRHTVIEVLHGHIPGSLHKGLDGL